MSAKEAPIRARYSIRVAQGNNRNHQVLVTVYAGSTEEAAQKALKLTRVHDPHIYVDNVEEVDE